MYDDGYPTCKETYATLRIYHGDLNPEAVSEALGIEAPRSWKRGDPLRPVGGSPRPARPGGWLLSTRGMVDSKDARRHLDRLLDLLEPKADSLQSLQAQGCSVDISCYWVSASGHGGPALSVEQMRRLTRLGVAVWFDVYFADDEEEESR